MREAIIVFIFFVLVGTSFAITIPSEEECAKEVDTALKNIEKGRRNLAGMDYTSGGSCYKNRKDYQKAAELFLKSVQLFLDINESGGAAVNYEGAADMYGNMNDSDTAKKYYFLAIEKYGKQIDYQGKPIDGNVDIAGVYKKLGDPDTACKYCRLAKVDYCEKYKYCVGGSTKMPGFPEGGSSSSDSSMMLVLGVVVVFIVVAAFFLFKKKKK